MMRTMLKSKIHRATVTDADLTLGYLNADFFLGGAMKIDKAATDKAVEKGKEAAAAAGVPGGQFPLLLCAQTLKPQSSPPTK